METSPPPGAGSRLRGLLFLWFILVLFAAYSNTFTSPPCLDDFQAFIYEKSLYLDELSVTSILSLVQSKYGYSRFIPALTFALNHKLGQSSLLYFHLINILIHLFAFLAVYFLAKQIVSVEKKRHPNAFSDNLAGWLPVFIAALWALNPVQTNAVTYLVQRIASLAGLFYFLGLGCYLKGRICSPCSPFKAAAYYTGFVLAGMAGVLSKQNAALLPVMVVLAEIWFFDSVLLKETWHSLRRRGWGTWLVIGTAGVVCFIIGLNIFPSKMFDGYALRHFTMMERLLTETRVVIWYLSLLLWPDPARLSLEHYVELSTSLISPPTTLVSLLFIMTIIGASIFIRKKSPIISFGILWYFINISMESTVIPLELIFEHRLYIPSFGIFLSLSFILALLARSLLKKLSEPEFNKAFCSILLLLTACSALLTFDRNQDWQSTLSIQYDAVSKAPELPRTNSNYAGALLRAGQFEEAVKYGEKSLELCRPGLETYVVASNSIVSAKMAMGFLEEAVVQGKELIANRPSKSDVDSVPFMHLNIAQACLVLSWEKDAYVQVMEALKMIEQSDRSSHKKETACETLRKVVQQAKSKCIDLNDDGVPDPGDMPVDFWIALELRKIGDRVYSRQLLEQEASRNPENMEVAKVVRELREQDVLNSAQKARWNFDQKYVSHPFSKFDFCMAVAFLAQERQMSGFFREIGERCLDVALEIEPNSPDALLLKGWYFYEADKAAEAVVVTQKALNADPQNAKAWLGLGFFQAKAGSAAEAVLAFKKTLELYPGYSRRNVIEDMCAQLEKGEQIKSFSDSRTSTEITDTRNVPAS
ncbi:MAG: hypothetical protein AB9866_24730 [Syntrophobacteraceae bacterium]